MKLSFSEFCIDSETAELSINGNKVPIDERNIMLIQLLADSYPDYCSKQTCLDTIWVGTIVSDMSLSKLVSDTRKIFCKAGYDNALIQTIHGRGYRLDHSLGKQLSQSSVTDNHVVDPPATVTEPSNQRDTYVERRKNTNPISWWEIFAKVLIALLLVLALVFQFRLGGVNSQSAVNTNYLNATESTQTLGRVLWIDDHPQNNLMEKAYFQALNIEVYSTLTSEEAMVLLSRYQYEAVISDMERHGDSLAGLKLLQSMRAAGHQVDFYIYTFEDEAGLIDTITRSGGQGVLVDSESLYEQVLAHF
ncbi:winged helix-turn-helix domain-containing protein [Shewanella youngdeokensis]|uniref:Winged helix-turn-helix domain-containing protein n=1 Tax=Shewanella youngdeokensis TaxID=2999068 RepID=A0ABZ0K1J7_9GAMM|nr:winged helix-turn-helix domain-containing protein [Shewanella sp. DAU334]